MSRPIENKPVRVLALLSTTSSHSGTAKVVVDAARHFASASTVDMRLGCVWRDDDEGQDEFAGDMRALGLAPWFFHHRGHRLWTAFNRLRTAVTRDRIDIIESHGFKPAVLCLCAKIFCRVRWICVLQGATRENPKVRFYHWLESTVQMFSDHAVVVSEAQRRQLPRGRNQRRVSVVHNAVDIDRPARVSPERDIRAELGIEAEEKLVAIIARLSPEKGIDLALDAFAQVNSHRIHLVIVGNGPELDSLVGHASAQCGIGRIHFMGHCSTPGDFIVASDIVVLPSRSEGSPNIALETMALSRTLVATAVGGTPEIVPDAEVGILVPPEDSGALARGIQSVIDDQALAQRLARAGPRHVRQNFSVTARCNRLQTIYHAVTVGTRTHTTERHATRT